MRIQFTDNGNTYTIETIKSFAKYLASKISDGTAKPGQTKFIADFALTSYDEDDEITIPEVLSDMRESGWYGVKELGEIGFNSTNRQFAFDYYGGQHLRVYDFDEGFMGKDDAEWKITEILTDIFDVSNDGCLLLIQWNEDKCLVDDAKEQESERENYYIEFYDKDRSEVIMQSAWMTEENARRWFQSNFDFTDYNHIAVNLIRADGDENNYDTIFIEKLF